MEKINKAQAFAN
jgi:HSP90 family molecular chaperone